MKHHAVLHCYKITSQPNLQLVVDFFQISDYNSRSQQLFLQPEQIETVLKMAVTDKYIWLFQIGCICLVNFDTSDTYRFLKYLESIGIKIDYELFSTFNELRTVDLESSVPSDHWIAFLQLQAIVMTKSLELKKLENIADLIFDQCEAFILDLQKGVLDPRSPRFIRTFAAIVKLQLEIINNLKILDRPANCSHELFLKETYDTASREFELERRFETLQQKITNLNEVLEPYRKQGYKNKERLLYIMEIILLALFPLFHFLNIYLKKFF